LNTKIYFAKLNHNATIPSKIVENAGMDIYACFDNDYLVILPNETKMIPTGIASVCSDDYYFQLFERGSSGTKGMGQRCGVIDSGYRGMWHVPITIIIINLSLLLRSIMKIF
jgi:dUTP pyrophosphatase